MLEKYRSFGLKLTPQRLAILECLNDNKKHPSAEEIYQDVRKQYPMMSFATVYNTLETLKQKGFLSELTIDPERRHYDSDTNHHHHLICELCKKIVDIHKDFVVTIPDEQRGSFEITGNHIEFYGRCHECKKKGG